MTVENPPILLVRFSVTGLRARFALAALDNPAALNKVIDLGDPEVISPLEAVRIFEELGGRPFAVSHVPVEALRAQYEEPCYHTTSARRTEVSFIAPLPNEHNPYILRIPVWERRRGYGRGRKYVCGVRVMLKKGKRGFFFWAVLLGSLLLTGILGTAGMAADPEPYLEIIPDSHFDPGPGWPAGWTPPQPPDRILPEQQAEYAAFNPKLPPAEQTAQLVLRVLPLPKWTPEYPYEWRYEYTNCGKTTYLYYYPYPDENLLDEMTGDVWAVTLGGGGPCGYGLVTGITKPLKPRPDEIERARLSAQMQDDRRAAREGLDDCPDWSDNRFESIQVCFNGGDASRTFDVAAYLDVEVSRVRVPVRFVSELMGAQVTWDEGKRQVTIVFPETSREVVKLISKPGFTPADWWDETKNLDYHTYDLKRVTVSQLARTIVLTVGQTTAYVNGQPVTVDAPPVIAPAGRTMVPLRFVSEQLGADVYWIGNEPIYTARAENRGTYQVHIYTQFHPWFEAPAWYLKKGE